MIVLDDGEDVCAGGEGHVVCGFYNKENDKCYFRLDDMHGRSCINYAADDSCIFCAIQKNYKCLLICDYISNDSKRCEDFRPVDIKNFRR